MATNHWRMSFRIGSQGRSLWSHCFENGVAVVTYEPLHGVDLTRHAYKEPAHLWKRLAPAQNFALSAVAYHMKPGDIVYAKEGPYIVGQGIVASKYRFDPGILRTAEVDWGHHLKVRWQADFPEGRIPYVGPKQSTVHLLDEEQLRELREKVEQTRATQKQPFAMEGQLLSCTRNFRFRDRSIIYRKKQLCDHTCEICEFTFERFYGDLGRDYIVIHHLNPIASRSRSSRTRLEDLIAVCQNCHAMLHRERPPITPTALRRAIKGQGRRPSA